MNNTQTTGHSVVTTLSPRLANNSPTILAGMLHILATGTDQRDPKEGEAEQQQNDYTDPRAIPAVVIDLRP